MTLLETLEQARDALKACAQDHLEYSGFKQDAAWHAIEEHIKLLENAEPVMFAYQYGDGSWHDASSTEHSVGMKPLFTHPAPQPKAEPENAFSDWWGTLGDDPTYQETFDAGYKAALVKQGGAA